MAYPVRFLYTLAAAAGVLALAAPAAARTIGEWDVKPSAKSCTMLSTFEDDVSIGLVSGKDGRLSFMTGGEGLAPFVRGGQKVSLDLKFAGKVPHDDWADEAAAVVALGDGQVMVIADWGPSLGHELADTVTASSTVTVRIGGQLVGTYDLSGSPSAYRELSRCGSEIASK